MALTLSYRGFNYVDFYNGIYDTTNLDTTMPEVAATGSDSVALTPDFGIDVATSTVYAGSATTDTVADLTAAVQEATAEGMTSFVRPLIDILYPQVSPNNGAPNYYVPDSFVSDFDNPGGNPTGATTIAYNPPGNTTYAGDTPAGVTPSSIPKGTSDGDLVNYRGELETTDEGGGDLNAATFFGSATTAGSYDYMIVTEAKAAAAAGATLFSIGTELDDLADDPNNTTYWDTLIADVRAAAPSLKLTYSANWSNAGEVTFWNKLDYVGIDGYVPLSNTIPNAGNTNNPSLASLEAGWNTVSSVVVADSGGQSVSQVLDDEGLGDVSAIDAFDTLAQQSMSKQFIFTELGYENDTGAANDPTGNNATGVVDPSLQAELFSAFFDAWGQAQATAAANDGDVDGIPFSLIGAYFWDYVPDGSNDGWSPELNSQAAAVINANFADPVKVVAETNSAGVAGREGEPSPARGTAGTSGTGALAGDSDINSAALSITAISGGTVGTSFTTKYGSLQLNADGSYTYFPTNSTALQDAPTGAPAADVIDFTVTDANGATAASSLTISVYRDPVVVAESATTTAGATVTRTAGTSGTGALAGDSDPDGVSLSASAIDDLGDPISNPIAGTYGTLTLNANGSYSYTANSAATLASAFSASGGAPLTDAFNLLVSGGLGTFNISTLSITIDHTPPTVGVKNVAVWENTSNAASSMITGLSNPSDDSITEYGFYDHGGGSGHFTVSGVTQADDTWIYVTPANLGTIDYVGGSAPGSQAIAIDVYDATTKSYSAHGDLTATTTVAPTVGVKNVAVWENTSIAASSMITGVSNPSDDSITKYGFYDHGGGSGHFTVSGVTQADDTWIYVTPANLGTVDYVGGSSPGSQAIAIDVYDATTGSYSAHGDLTATTTVAPTVDVKNVAVWENTSIAGSSMITGVSNPSDDSITKYGFYNHGGGSGHFTVGGVTQADDTWIYVTPANLGTVDYVGGSAPGSQTIAVDVYDATTQSYSANSHVTATTTVAPMVSVKNVSVAENASIAASSMITGVSNPSDDSITKYGFYDHGGGSGHFTVGGVTQADDTWIYVTPANLGTVDYVGGSAAGSQAIAIDVYDATTESYSMHGDLTATTTVAHGALAAGGALMLTPGSSASVQPVVLPSPSLV